MVGARQFLDHKWGTIDKAGKFVPDPVYEQNRAARLATRERDQRFKGAAIIGALLAVGSVGVGLATSKRGG